MSPRKTTSDKRVATPKQIGAQARGRRQELKLSMRQVAERMGLQQQQVQKYESGISEMTMTRAQQMAIVLGVTLDYFVKPARS